MKIKCQVCGQEFETNRLNTKYCSKLCRMEANKKPAKEYQPKIKYCVICGAEIEITSPKQGRKKYCPPCTIEQHRLQDRESADRHKYEYAEKVRRRKIAAMFKKDVTIAQIGAAAQKLHLSYGKYVGLLYMGYTPSRIIALYKQNCTYNE